jgi:hypothetical protein
MYGFCIIFILFLVKSCVLGLIELVYDCIFFFLNNFQQRVLGKSTFLDEHYICKKFRESGI